MTRWTQQAAEDYAAVGRQTHIQIIAPRLPELLGDLTGKHLLDFGCGPGRLSLAMIEHGAAHVSGLDESEVMIETARREASEAGVGDRVSYCVGDETNLPTERAYDGVLCSLALMMCETRGRLQRAIGGIVGSLRPGGRAAIVLTHPCFRSEAYPTFHYNMPDNYRYFNEGQPYEVHIQPTESDSFAVIEDYHWPVSTYMNVILETGAAIRRVLELPAAYDAKGHPAGDPAYLAIAAERVQ